MNNVELDNNSFPKQNISYSQKNKKWREQCVTWAANKSFYTYSPIRTTMINKRVNYDLVAGKIHMEDIKKIINPKDLGYITIPENLQHYSLINPKIDTLIGELTGRPFDYRVVVTNPNAISQIEESKRDVINQTLQQIIQSTISSDEEFEAKMQKMSDYFTFEYQDMKELRANQLLNHYSKEYNIPLICTNGFRDALITGEEVYRCLIIGGEPTFERVNNQKLSVFSSGYSNRIEDADILIHEDYLSPGQIVDRFHESLSQKDVEFIENGCKGESSHPADNYGLLLPEEARNFAKPSDLFYPSTSAAALSPFDTAGNIRVMTVYWKSKRKILKVKSFNPESGEVVYDLYPENYKPNKDLGEEIVKTMWINQAWEGTLIGGYDPDDKDNNNGLIINVKPCDVQYNSISNPSRCHFGYVGTIYNLNDDRPYSLVDRMKPLSYMYDIIMYNLIDAISSNFGAIIDLDIDSIPDGWKPERWFYYAKNYKMSLHSSMKMGTGEASGRMVGSSTTAGHKILSAPIGDYIQQLVNLLDWINSTSAEMVGISRQRIGNIANRETKGGVERSVLQSSYVTEWLFKTHEDTVKRALECFLETAKIALRGRNVKFNYILADQSMRIMDVDGTEFAECDYGLVVEQTNNTALINERLDQLALAASQNGAMDVSAYMKTMFSTLSLAEKARIIQKSEQDKIQQQQQQQQQQLQAQQQQIQAQLEQKDKELQAKIDMNTQDNNTNVLVAQINAQARLEQAAYTANSFNGINGNETPESVEKERKQLEEKIREFDKKYELDKERLEIEKRKVRAQESKASTSSNKKS